MKCNVCSHSCNLSEGKVGLCRVRTVNDDSTFPSNYGRVTSISLMHEFEQMAREQLDYVFLGNV